MSRGIPATHIASGTVPLVTTAIEPVGPFYFAEPEHQQYLDRVPNGYCGLAGTGVACRADRAVG